MHEELGNSLTNKNLFQTKILRLLTRKIEKISMLMFLVVKTQYVAGKHHSAHCQLHGPVTAARTFTVTEGWTVEDGRKIL